MAGNVMIRAHIATQESHGSTSRSIPSREYRLIESNGRARADTFARGSAMFTVLQRNGNLLLYVSAEKAHIELPDSDAAAEPMRIAIGRLHNKLYQRFSDLERANVRVTARSMDEIKVGDEKKPCHNLKIKPAADQPQRWSGELWIDASNYLIVRARLLTHGDGGASLDEDVRVSEIRTGDDVPVGELDWQPPAGSGRLARIPTFIP